MRWYSLRREPRFGPRARVLLRGGRGGRFTGLIPLPAAAQVLDQCHAALSEQGLAVLQILSGRQQRELLGQQALLARPTPPPLSPRGCGRARLVSLVGVS